MRFAVRVFFKNIYLHNLDKVPVNKPLILASNHPSAFMDAIVLSVFMKQELHFLVRSDVFDTSLKRWILGKINLAPIYRIQEGVDQLHKNEETFDKCNQLLKSGKTILIFSEGVCVQEKRLRKLKKGTARIAFGAEAATDFKLDLQIVPAGINYTRPAKFRSDLFINFGESFPVQEFVPAYMADKVKGINALTQRVEAELAKRLIIISDKINDELVEKLEKIYLPELAKKENKPLDNSINWFTLSKSFAEAISKAYQANNIYIETLREKVKAYFNMLDALNIRDKIVREGAPIKKEILFSKIILLTLLFPIYVYGMITNYIPFRLPYYIARKIVKQVEFFSSVNLTLGTFLFMVVYGIETVVVNSFFGPAIAVVFLASLPLSGYFSLYYWIEYKKIKGQINYNRAINKNYKEVTELKKLRQEIIAVTEKVVKPYTNKT